jgi:dipeptidyl-peptidase 4
MKKNILFTLFLFTITIVSQTKKPLNLEEIFYKNIFSTHRLDNVQWRPDSKAFTYTERDENGNEDIYKHDVISGSNTLLVKADKLIYNSEEIKMSSYQWTKDGKYLLIEGPSVSIWRHSTQAPYYLYDVTAKEITALAKGDIHLRNVKLSPNGKLVGFVRGHNLYIADLATGNERALTTNGSENILNGEFDWVYEEEFSIADAWRWSPDSKKIAYWHFDQTRVKEFHLVDELPVYNKVSSLKYVKVGEQNSIVKICVIDLAKDKTTFMDIGKNDDIYIPRIYWTNSSSTLSILRLNRKQNVAELLLSDTESGISKPIITDTDLDWVEVKHDISFLKSRDQIVFSSEKSGFRHAYIYDYQGNLLKQVTSGDWEITDICGVDENNNWLYFYGKKDSPIEQQVYRVKLDGTGFAKISSGKGWHRPNFSPDYSYFIDSYSNATTPTKTTLCKTDGTEIDVLKDGKVDALENYNITYPEYTTFKTTDGTELNAYFIKPYDFDSTKKYPVIIFGYGGPGSQEVTNEWGSSQRWFNQYMTSRGYIVFCLDNRGTGGRGKAFKNLSYGDLSKWAIHDHIEGVKYLASLSYVDKNRIGAWGWSGGGYLTVGLLTRGADYFKAGIAVAPVTDFRDYDAPWTERYMGLLTDNPEGYDKANLQNSVDLLKGKLLMIHGTGDDNVHYQNTLQFIDKCIKANKHVDMFFYPNKNHSIYGGYTSLNLFTKMSNYFEDNL